MTSRLARLAAALVLASTLALPPALAGDEPQGNDPGALAEEGMKRLVEALEALIATIPQYELPEVLENGDIIIRRVRPQPERDDGTDGVEETAI